MQGIYTQYVTAVKHQPDRSQNPTRSALLRLPALLAAGSLALWLTISACIFLFGLLYSSDSTFSFYINLAWSVMLPCLFCALAIPVAFATRGMSRISTFFVSFVGWFIVLLPVAYVTVYLLVPFVVIYPVFGLVLALVTLMFRVHLVDLLKPIL